MQTITVTGGNLFALAAQVYADATLWYLIASTNQILDPWLSGIITLNVPSFRNQIDR